LSLLGPNILNNLFSDTFIVRSSPNVSNQVSHPYKTTGKIIVDVLLCEKGKPVLRLNCSLLCKYRGVHWRRKFANVGGVSVAIGFIRK
jgi:hypothetical protein